ncbi:MULTISPECIES: hypothetical protein [Clostridium]|jgi:hypothetical protein|uniref:hypothetical protein n=1 Tax=Clostridium TaxID=1485 RepID=UPI001C863B87|nr:MULTISPECIES: hypothetical protein [Clostridium]MDJ8959765.1 hypothetical protein [Clostridium perfringens]MDU4427622.1 hypothetical protein [Clostridium sp.]MDU7458769.1 hypothetical protein [Clostridium perfringens]
MFSGRINSYKGYINSKKIYLKRKKQLNREIKIIKRKKKKSKSIGKKYFGRIIEKGKDDIYILRIMYNNRKREYKLKSKRKRF